MDDITNKCEQQQSETPEDVSQNLAANETECHIRNLILNTNITITAAQPQRKSHSPTEENKQDKENVNHQEAVSCGNVLTSPKKRKLSVDICENAMPLNPLASLPVSLISNGTLSVTSESACVAIENGIPILKEAYYGNKQTTAQKQANVSVTTLAPVLEIVSTKQGNCSMQPQTVEQLQAKNSNCKINESVKSSKEPLSNKKFGTNAQSQDVLSINNIILKSLTDVAKVTPFGKIGLIPNPNQMDFLTLLGLEIVVNSCCADDDAPKQTESLFNQSLLLCGQCHTDFTTIWHFYKSPLQVLCDHCFTYNEHQILKAAQTVRLAKDYTKAFQLKQKTSGMHLKVSDTCPPKSECLLSTRLPTQHAQNQLFQDYINAAGIFTKGADSVSDLARLGASIASNSDIFEAAKAVNSLDSTSTPLLRAKAVQNFQIALFNGLHEKLSPLNETKIQDQTLLCYQMTIAQMMKQTNVNALQSENQIVETPLAGIVRAIKAQHHSLMKTILKQVPKAVNYGIEDKKN